MKNKLNKETGGYKGLAYFVTQGMSEDWGIIIDYKIRAIKSKMLELVCDPLASLSILYLKYVLYLWHLHLAEQLEQA